MVPRIDDIGCRPGDPGGPSIQTVSGNLVHLNDPKVADIDIGDIAHALSHICRYTGHCREFYSVAQHSVLVSRCLPPHLALWGLLHDAAEAYIGDVSKPLKLVIEDSYGPIEERMEAVIAERFGLTTPIPAEVKEADLRMLVTEKRDLMAECDWGRGLPEPYDFRITAWSPAVARRRFRMTFWGMTKDGVNY